MSMWGALVVTRTSPQGAATAVGVVTDRDLAIEVLARGRDGANVSVGSLVSGRLVAVRFEATLSDAIAAMEGEGDYEMKAGLPASLTVNGLPLILSNEALLPY